MDLIEPVKRLAEKATGIGIPSRDEALACVRDRRPAHMKFRDDGYIPNNPKYPLLYYRKALRFGRKHDPAAVLKKCSMSTAGATPGATAFMTSCIITR